MFWEATKLRKAKLIPLVFIGAEVASLVERAADSLRASDLVQSRQSIAFNPLTGSEHSMLTSYRVQENSPVPDRGYFIFERPISFGHPTFLVYGWFLFGVLVHRPGEPPAGPASGVWFGLYDRDEIARAEGTGNFLNARSAPKMWLAPIDADEIERAVTFRYALMQFASQSLIQTSAGILPRHERRRRLREGDEEPPETTVVSLRRVAHRHAGGEPAVVDWSHRWFVNGHWRYQYYPSTRDHRQVWISPYIKGPEDKPLVVKQKIYRVVR